MSQSAARTDRMLKAALNDAGLDAMFARLGKPPVQFGKVIESRVRETPELDQQIASARRDMGEARWAELNAEWERPL